MDPLLIELGCCLSLPGRIFPYIHSHISTLKHTSAVYSNAQLNDFICQSVIVSSSVSRFTQRKHQAMYDDFVKRKDMKREGYSSGSLHSFTTNGGNTRYALPTSTGGGGGGMGTLEGGVGGGAGGGVTKFDRHDPRQVCVFSPSLQVQIRKTERTKSHVCRFFFTVGSNLRGHS